MATVYWMNQGTLDITSKLGIKWFAKYSPAFGKEQWFLDIVSGAAPYSYVSPAGDLGPSVATFCILACSCVVVLMLRRKFAGGELGGPDRLRNISAVLLVTFWLIYIIVSATIAYNNLAAASA